MTSLKLTAIGNSTGVIFPKDLLSRLNVGPGDVLYLTEAPDGVRLSPYNPEFAEEMAAAERVMKTRRAVLRELAR